MSNIFKSNAHYIGSTSMDKKFVTTKRKSKYNKGPKKYKVRKNKNNKRYNHNIPKTVVIEDGIEYTLKQWNKKNR